MTVAGLISATDDIARHLYTADPIRKKTVPMAHGAGYNRSYVP